MDDKSPKMSIMNGTDELKVYMFSVEKGGSIFDRKEDFKMILAYTDSDAVASLLKDYVDIPVFVKKKAQLEVKKIVDKIDIELLIPKQESKIDFVPPIPVPTKEKTEKEFVQGIMLVADKFITDKRDRSTLKRIVKKIKVNEDTKPD